MKSFFYILPALLLLVVGVVHAQESPFGNLNEEADTGPKRLVESYVGQTIADYLELVENYKNLASLYERSYGARKTELALELNLRAKDVLTSKLGAIDTYLTTLQYKSSETGFLSEDGELQAAAVPALYEITIGTYQSVIETDLTLEELGDLSKILNEELAMYGETVRPQIALVAVFRGEHLISQIESRTPVILAHLAASEALGGNTAPIKADFDKAMLNLEDARDDYKTLKELAAGGAPTDTSSYGDLSGFIRNTNNSMRRAYDGLDTVLADLRALYGQSPWDIDTSQFDLNGEEVTTETESEVTDEVDDSTGGEE